MTDLTLEELAALDALRVESVGSGGHYMLGGGAADQRYMRALLPATESLIAMARELVRIKSALEYLSDDGSKLVTDYRRPGEMDLALSAHNITRKAQLLGWADPTTTKSEG